jgi:hypothetical protein
VTDHPGKSVIKHFLPSLTKRPDKLQRLSLLSIPSLALQANIRPLANFIKLFWHHLCP